MEHHAIRTFVGQWERWREHAEAAGVSLNEFIRNAVDAACDKTQDSNA